MRYVNGHRTERFGQFYGKSRRKAMRIMGNEDGMGSLNRGALMEIGPALPADIVAP